MYKLSIVRLATAVCLILALNTCKTPLEALRLEELSKLVEMSKGPCYGRCPIYTLTVFDDGIVSYRGERYSDKMGLHINRLEPALLSELRSSLEAANFWRLKGMYPSRIPDLQTVTITYYEDGDIKSVAGKENRPAEVMRVEGILDRISQSDGWIQREKPTYDLPENYIPSEIIVQLKRGVDTRSWIRRYMKQDMQVVRSLSPNGFYWLVSYNPDAIPPQEMLSLIRLDTDVLTAEFNKVLEER